MVERTQCVIVSRVLMQKRYLCPHGCGQEFHDRRNLVHHVRAKHEQRRYVCAGCFRVFSYSYNLSRHRCHCTDGGESAKPDPT